MPKTYKVILSSEAGKNIEQAYHWIAEADPKAAKRWYNGLIGALEKLSQFPLRCPLAPESRLGLLDVEIHQLLYGSGFWKYRILFAIEGDRVLIAHVRHGARLYLGQEESEPDEPE